MSNILVVEDNKHNMRLFKQILLDVEKEATVVEATSGAEAIEKAEDHPYDLVLMDISLPDMDGIQTLKELKKITAFESTVFIAVTAHASKEDQEKLRLDFDDYCPKPIDEDAMVVLVQRALKR